MERHSKTNTLFDMSEKSIEDTISIHDYSIGAYNTSHLDGMPPTHFTYSINIEVDGMGSFIFEIVHNINTRRAVTRLSNSKKIWHRGVASNIPRDPGYTGKTLSERQMKVLLSKYIIQKRYDLLFNRL